MTNHSPFHGLQGSYRALKERDANRAIQEAKDPMLRELRGFKTMAERDTWRAQKEPAFGKYWLK